MSASLNQYVLREDVKPISHKFYFSRKEICLYQISDLPRSIFFARALFCDCNSPCHSFMAASTENIAVKLERTHLLRHESQFGHFLRRDIGADSKSRATESMQSVQRREFQHHRVPFFHPYIFGRENKPLRRYLDHLFRVSRNCQSANYYHYTGRDSNAGSNESRFF
jgi:hypothetical protein